MLTLEELRSLGVAFCSYHENLDFTTATGQLMFHLLAAFAEPGPALISERVKAGLANVRAKGKRLGRPRRVVDVRRVEELRASGASLRVVTKQMGVSTTVIQGAVQVSGAVEVLDRTKMCRAVT